MADNTKSRKERAEETKLHIFNTALKLLEEIGFEKITVRHIVKAAEVSIGTFYYYYASKLDVFYETYYLADQYFEEVVSPKLTQTTAAGRLYCFFEHYAKYCSDITSITLTSILFNSNNKCFDRESTYGMLTILPDIIKYGQLNGELRRDKTPYEISRFLMIAARGLVYDWCIHEGSYNLHSALSSYIKSLLKGILN